MRRWSDLTWGERVILARGKLRRYYLVHFRPRFAERSIARRQGHCHRTGACCNLLIACPVYTSKPLPTCRINRWKPEVCKMFPIDERDIRDRNIISPDVPCGFFFPAEDPPGEVLPNP